MEGVAFKLVCCRLTRWVAGEDDETTAQTATATTTRSTTKTMTIRTIAGSV